MIRPDQKSNSFSIILVFISFFVGSYCIKVEPLSLPFDGFYCYVTCLARCVQNPNQTIERCKPQCGNFENKTNPLCQKNDTSCWKSACGGPANKSVLDPPVISRVNFTDNPEPNPRKVELEWAHVKNSLLYIVQYIESDDSFVTWATGGLDKQITVANHTVITKKNLCPEYQFRVAAVGLNGISLFSDVVTLHKPVPIMPNPKVTLIDSVLLHNSYQEPSNTFQWNDTVRATIEFNPPPGWNLTKKEIEPVFLQPFLLQCKQKGYTFPTPRTIYDPNQKPLVYYDFPSFVYDKECTFIITLDKIKSQCGTIYKYPANSGILFVNFTCENTRNVNCSHKYDGASMNCSYRLTTDYNSTTSNHSNTVPVRISWKPPVKTPGPISSYTFNVAEIEKPASTETFGQRPTILKQLNLLNFSSSEITHLNNETDDILMDDVFQKDKHYAIRMCAVYNQSSAQNFDWNVMAWDYLDLKETSNGAQHLQNLDQHLTSRDFALIIGCSVGAALIVAVIVAGCWMKWSYNKKKVWAEMESRGGEYWDDGRYVDMPRRLDTWEIPRKRLEIFVDQKLGSGAFGSVFKGFVTGRLLNHKEANSPLAERWMQAENCEVAVKMLPEYADDSSKSDFRKEINLMKQIGPHERLVNMLACITVDEPLCLVVDYCSDGDLLHFLRDRRQYMIKLQNAGIATDDPSVDVNMLLCMKDLISFAWQISVGLEYLSQKKFIHRDVAARNVLVDKGKKAKIGDFGLCRYSCSDPIYMGKGGRLPIKWMAIEAIKSYEFTTKSDVWSFGVLLFEIITVGGSPYPGVQPSDMQQTLEAGKRMEQPDNCPDDLYQMLLATWHLDPDKRPEFTDLRESLRKMLEELTSDYYYMSLNTSRDYYNVVYGEDHEVKVPSSSDDAPSTSGGMNSNSTSFTTLSNEEPASFDSDQYPKKPVVVKPPVPPRSLRQSSNDSLIDETRSTGVRNRHRDSSNSEQVLITPQDKKTKFFKFKPTELDDLTETSNGSEYTDPTVKTSYSNVTVNHLPKAYSNQGYTNTLTGIDDELL